MSGVIYKITNQVNGKIYIGQTVTSSSSRWRAHVFDAMKGKSYCKYLSKAIRKYGKESFVVEDLFYVLDDSYLDDFEIYFISQYNSFKVGYNLTEGGGGLRGHSLSEEVRRKISDSNKGLKRSDETRKNVSIVRTGLKNERKYSDDILKAKSERMKGSGNPMYGKPPSEEHKKKLSDALIGEKSPFYGIPKSDDIKSKLRKSQPHVIPVSIDGVEYDSIRQAAEKLNITKTTVSRWLRVGKALKV